MNKMELRKQLRNSLAGITQKKRIEKSSKVCQNLISTPQFKNASTIMFFLSMPHEVDTTQAILHSWQLKKTVVVPKVSWQQRHMIPVMINTLETDFSVEHYELRNPVFGVPVPYEEIDLIVTPGLGFDKKGNRLGRGGSYYDNFFGRPELKAIKCGLAFSEQVVDNVPISEHDKPVDMLVTDSEIIYFNKKTDMPNQGD